MNNYKDNVPDDLYWLNYFNLKVELNNEAENLVNAKNVNEYNKMLKRLCKKYGFENNIMTYIFGMATRMLFDSKLEYEMKIEGEQE